MLRRARAAGFTTLRHYGRCEAARWCGDALRPTRTPGEVTVLASGTTFKVLGRTQIGEPVHGTPAVAGGRMFVRGFEHLYCLTAK